MDFNLKITKYTCLFLATKTEEARISLPEFATKCGLSHEEVIRISKMEYVLLEALDCQLHICNPIPPLDGFIIKLQTVMESTVSLAIRMKALKNILAAIAHDTMFLYSPSQIALAALKDAIPEDLQQMYHQILNKVFSDHPQWKWISHNVEEIEKNNCFAVPSPQQVEKIKQMAPNYFSKFP